MVQTPYLWCILPRAVRTEELFANKFAFSTKLLKVKLLAGEQKATELWGMPRCHICKYAKTPRKNGDL